MFIEVQTCNSCQSQAQVEPGARTEWMRSRQVSFLSLTCTEEVILHRLWKDVFCWLDVNKNYIFVDVVIVAESLRPCCHWKIHSVFIIPAVIN